jgi:methyltransferase
MRVVYPAAFVAMIVESAIRGGPPPLWFLAGMVIWIAAKLLKAWAISALGDRWSFRVLVLPGMLLTTTGPYRWLRHPNYVAVAGELIGVAVGLAAPVTGIIFTLAFLEILRRRIRVEERALRAFGYKGLTDS